MNRVHEGLPDKQFSVPENIVTAQICRKSGKLAIPGVCELDPRGNAVYTEFFESGNVPTEFCDHHTTVSVCAESLQQITQYCPLSTGMVATIVPEEEAMEATFDSNFSALLPCQLHNIFNPNDYLQNETVPSIIITQPGSGEYYDDYRPDYIDDYYNDDNVIYGPAGGSQYGNHDGLVEPGPGDR